MTGRLQSFRRIVVKIGSALLVDPTKGLRVDWLNSVADDLRALHTGSSEVLVVSSGAIALGRLQLDGRDEVSTKQFRLDENQAAAAIGQIQLGRVWAEALAARQITAGQILLTLSDTEERRRYLNARDTVNTLLRWNAIPVINENDTVATNEIRYGDNDRLAARVASMAEADLLVLLSDVEGLFSAPPATNPDATLIKNVPAITPGIESMAGESSSAVGSGGMKTKIAAAKIATAAGVAMAIASGRQPNPLKRLDEGASATWFEPSQTPINNRKRWIAGTLDASGSVTIDEGAARAIAAGKSLLPVGVVRIDGSFCRGDTVLVRDPDGQVLGRGLIEYDDEVARQSIGKPSDELAALLGNAWRPVMIHRDDLALE